MLEEHRARTRNCITYAALSALPPAPCFLPRRNLSQSTPHPNPIESDTGGHRCFNGDGRPDFYYVDTSGLNVILASSDGSYAAPQITAIGAATPRPAPAPATGASPLRMVGGSNPNPRGIRIHAVALKLRWHQQHASAWRSSWWWRSSADQSSREPDGNYIVTVSATSDTVVTPPPRLPYCSR